MDKRAKKGIDRRIVELDKGWDDHIDKISTDSLGLTLKQFRKFDTLEGEEARAYLKKHSTKKKQ